MQFTQLLAQIGQTSLTALLSIVVLFILAKLMGTKQVSQMTMFDYAVGITIGSVAAELATELEEPAKPLTALILYGVVAFLISILTNKSVKARAVVTGKPLVLLENGVIYRQNLKKARLDLNEFLTQCRINGYFNIDDLQTVVMELNGQLSCLPKSTLRPMNPQDMGMHPEKETSPIVVVSDGEILFENLKACGKNEVWLRKALKDGNFPPVGKIFTAFVNDGKLSVYEINEENNENDIYS